MAIKTLIEPQARKHVFPCLKGYRSQAGSTTVGVVLFISENEGIIVQSFSGWHGVGTWKDNWEIHMFDDFYGDVSVFNDGNS